MKSLKSIIALFTAVIFVIMLGCDTGSVSETTEEQWSHDGRVGFFYAIMGSNSEGKAKIFYQSERSSAPAMKVYQKHKPLTDAELPTLSDIGYTFCGWRDGKGVMAAAGSYSLDKNVTLTAVWTPNHYTIVYHSNTTANKTAEQSAEYDKTFSLAANSFDPPTVYDHFAGWSASPSGSIIYEDEKQVKNLTATDGGVVNLYAVWLDSSSLPIVYHNVEPTDINTSPKSFHADENVTLGTVTRDGYTFLGWYTEENFIHKITGWLPNTYNDAVHLYAKWVLCWRIHYEPNGADVTGDMPDQNINDTESVILIQNVYTRPKHIFIGWNTRSDGSGTTYSDKQSFKPTENMTLYAQWHAYRYITFDKNAGDASGTMAVQEVLDGVSAPLAANNFTREHYTVSRWNTKSDGSGEVYYSGANIVVCDGDITLYAQWIPKQYKYTVYLNKPSYELGSSTGSTSQYGNKDYGSSVTIKSAANLNYSCEHYTFTGWNTKADGSGTSYPDQPKFTLTGNIDLYAQWTPKEYTISYYLYNKGSYDAVTTKTYYYADTVKMPTLTTTYTDTDSNGMKYTFKGWTKTSKTASSSPTINYTNGSSYTLFREGNVSLYAVYELTYPAFRFILDLSNVKNTSCESESGKYAVKNGSFTYSYKYYQLPTANAALPSCDAYVIEDATDKTSHWFIGWSTVKESLNGDIAYVQYTNGESNLASKLGTMYEPLVLFPVWFNCEVFADIPAGTLTNSTGYQTGTWSLSSFKMSRTELCNREAYQVMKAYPNLDYFTECKAHYPKIEVPNSSNQNMPVRYMPALFYISFCNRLSELTGRTPCYTNVVDSSYIVSTKIKDVVCSPTNNGFRLPSYVEWTYAANANKGYTYSGTNDINGKNGSLPYISPPIVSIRSIAPNAWGLRGMSGNVAELCHFNHNVSSSYNISIKFCREHGLNTCHTHTYPSEDKLDTLLALGSKHPNYSPDRCYEVFGFMRRGLTGYDQADEYTCYYAGWSAYDDGTNNVINRYIGARIMYK